MGRGAEFLEGLRGAHGRHLLAEAARFSLETLIAGELSIEAGLEFRRRHKILALALAVPAAIVIGSAVNRAVALYQEERPRVPTSPLYELLLT